ncbi:MAG: rhamnulokinase family protein [Roseiflexaceae bacterium]
MTVVSTFLAFDLGASSGRALIGRWDGSHFSLEELHRFENGPIDLAGNLHWDALRLWSELKSGMAQYAANHAEPLAGIGVDTWGVDYGLLDRRGNLIGNPYNYRDRRTEGLVDVACAAVGRDTIFAATGIQFMEINTLYQLYSAARANDPQFGLAETLLLMPDLFHYWMTGRIAVEYTNATTTQMLDCRTRTWAHDLLGQLGIATSALPAIVAPGTILGPLRVDLAREVGFAEAPLVITPATHDTASAVAAVPGLDQHSAYISSGTWSLVGVETPEPITTAQALALNVTNEGGVEGTIRLLKNVSGLWLLQESRRQWQREGQHYSWDDLLGLAAQAPALVSLIDPDAPEFARPGDLPALIRAFCARTQQPIPATVGAVVRCCLESLALRYRWVIEALASLTGRPIAVVRVVGGGSQNRMLCQLTADACGLPVVAGPVEATALGNIMIQAVACGVLPSVAAGRQALAASFRQERYMPLADAGAADRAAWEAAYARWQRLMV